MTAGSLMINYDDDCDEKCTLCIFLSVCTCVICICMCEFVCVCVMCGVTGRALITRNFVFPLCFSLAFALFLSPFLITLSLSLSRSLVHATLKNGRCSDGCHRRPPDYYVYLHRFSLFSASRGYIRQFISARAKVAKRKERKKIYVAALRCQCLPVPTSDRNTGYETNYITIFFYLFIYLFGCIFSSLRRG